MVAGKEASSSRAGITTLNNFSGSADGFNGVLGFTMFLRRTVYRLSDG
jgi:hypothetical protein